MNKTSRLMTMFGGVLMVSAAACGSAPETTSSSSAESLTGSCTAAEGFLAGTAAQSTGDPHMLSGDGLAFEDQSGGWHVEAKSVSAIDKSSASSWQLQVSADQYVCAPGVRCSRAVDIYVAGSRLHFTRAGVVRVNGAQTSIGAPLALPFNVSVTHNPPTDSVPCDQYIVTNALGETITLNVFQGVTIDIYVNLSRLRKSDRVGGILGCFDHDTDSLDDLCHRDKCGGSYDSTDPAQISAFLDEWRVGGSDDADTSE